jgi:hypothetical protein
MVEGSNDAFPPKEVPFWGLIENKKLSKSFDGPPFASSTKCIAYFNSRLDSRVLIKHTFYLTKKNNTDSCKFFSIYVQYHRLIVLNTNQ